MASSQSHVTAVPEQLRSDEIRFIVTGDDLHEQVSETAENLIAVKIAEMLQENYGVDFDSVSVERGRQPI